MSNSWTQVKLGEILDEPLRNGVSPSTEGDVEATVLMLSAITGASFDSSAHKLGRFRNSPPSHYRVNSSDLLICRGNGNRTLVGRGFFPGESRVDLVFPDTIIAARISQTRVDPSYVQYLWNSSLVRAQIEPRARTTNGTFKINQEILHEIVMPLPPIADQRRIVEILDYADELLTKRRKTIALLNDLAQSIFLDMFGDPANNLLSWPVYAFGDVCQVLGGLQVMSARKANPVEIPYLRVANVYRGKLDLSVIKTMRVVQAELERTKLERGDLLIVEGHGNPQEIGRAAVWDGSISPCTHQNHIIRVRLNRDIMLPEYACSYLNSWAGRRHLLRAAKTTSGLNTISTSNVKSTPIMVPPADLQRNFSYRLAAVESMAMAHSRHLTELDSLFSSLQHRAFQGDLLDSLAHRPLHR